MPTVTLTPTADVMIAAGTATTNYGTLDELDIGVSGASDTRRSLLAFDTSSIPAGATISSATLQLTQSGQDVNEQGHGFTLYTCLRAFTEAGATWNTYDGTTAWATAGGLGAGDYSSANSATGTTPANSTAGSVVTTGQIPSAMIATGASAVTRFIVKDTTEATTFAKESWYSREDATAGNRPTLSVTYTAGGPTAGTLTLGATGATTQALSLATNTGGTPPYSNQLQQSTNGGTTWTNVGAPVAGATASWTVTGLTPGQAYQFRVNPVTDSASGSATSNTVSVTIPATTITAPSAAKLAANTAGNTVKATGTGTNWTAGNAEVQSLVDTGATAGTFTLTFGGQTTAAIAYNAAAAAVQSALQALSSIGAGNVTCVGGPLPSAVTITFSGTLAPGPQALITTTSTGLTGGTAAVTRTTAGVAATAFSLAGLSGAAVTAATVNSATSVTLTVTSSTVDVAGTLTLSNNADPSIATVTVVSSVGGATRRRPQ